MSHLPELRRSLVDAAHRQREIAARDRREHAPPTPRGHWTRRWLSAFPVALAVAATVAVGAGALIVLRTGRSTEGSGPGTVTAPDAHVRLPLLGSSHTLSLAGLRGHVMVLNVFASWCEPCAADIPALVRAQARINWEEATVLGVATHDRTASATRFVGSHHVDYPVVVDPAGRFARALGIAGVPATVVIDPRGRIAATRVGALGASGDRWLEHELHRLLGHLGNPAGRSQPGPSSDNPLSPSEPAPSPAAVAAMARAYPVLGRAQRPADVPPRDAFIQYPAHSGGTFLNARRALVTPRGESVYVVPAHHAICIVSSDSVAQGCGRFPPVHPNRPRTIGTTICSPALPSSELEIDALMPPGVSDVRLRYSDGSSRALTVTNGVIAVTTPRSGPLPESITWTGPHGPGHSRTGVPPDASSSGCG